jgi:Fur family zinc uptake transcriptional regulator
MTCCNNQGIGKGLIMTKTNVQSAFAEHGHDHNHCLNDAVERAISICAKRGARLTVLRRQVLELIWAGHTPLGAYDILEKLRQKRGNAAPPTVYRALDFLLNHGLIHRIERLNAYVGCTTPEQPHGGQFLICRCCGATAELNDQRIDTAISEQAERAGFLVENLTIEVDGICPHCKSLA